MLDLQNLQNNIHNNETNPYYEGITLRMMEDDTEYYVCNVITLLCTLYHSLCN